MTDFEKFRMSSLDTAAVGLLEGAKTSGNVFTPQNAAVIGWADENAHFCFVEGFGETVFSVDPLAAPGENILPVAGSFSHFLGLILACKDTDPIRMAGGWTRSKFEETVEGRQLSMKQRSVLRALENTYHPPKIRDPYDYIRSIQADFDYKSLPLHPDYDEHCAYRPGPIRWRVCFNDSFFPSPSEGRNCREVPMGKSFSLGSEKWHIPAIYTCDKGYIVDCCTEIPPEGHNPFVAAALKIGSSTIHNYTENSLLWDPDSDSGWQARHVAEHYNLDLDKAWVIRRYRFSHRRKKDAPASSLSITLMPQPVKLPGPSFTVSGEGDTVEFNHPVTGAAHTLSVKAYSREALDPNFLYDPPCYYTLMSYSLSPELEARSFAVQDTAENDPLRQPRSASPVEAVIGSADGPAAVFFPVPKGKHHTVVSSLHYKPVDKVVWQMVFREKVAQDETVLLLDRGAQ